MSPATWPSDSEPRLFKPIGVSAGIITRAILGEMVNGITVFFILTAKPSALPILLAWSIILNRTSKQYICLFNLAAFKVDFVLMGKVAIGKWSMAVILHVCWIRNSALICCDFFIGGYF